MNERFFEVLHVLGIIPTLLWTFTLEFELSSTGLLSVLSAHNLTLRLTATHQCYACDVVLVEGEGCAYAPTHEYFLTSFFSLSH